MTRPRATDEVFCGRCGRPGHRQVPSLDPDRPLVRCGRSLLPSTRDPAEAMAIRDARQAERERKAAVRSAALTAELIDRYAHDDG